MTHSLSKGKLGERELAKEIVSHFFAHGANIMARRGQQYSGIEGQDVVTSIDGLHVECKRVERLNVQEAIEQSIRDAGDKLPIVCHRKNRKPWLVTLRLDDLIPFCSLILKARGDHVSRENREDD